MNLETLKNKLADLFDAQSTDSDAMRDKLSKIIEKLTEKKEQLKEDMLKLGEEDQTSEAYEELEHEYRAVSKLLKNAKKQYSEEVDAAAPDQ